MISSIRVHYDSSSVIINFKYVTFINYIKNSNTIIFGILNRTEPITCTGIDKKAADELMDQYGEYVHRSLLNEQD